MNAIEFAVEQEIALQLMAFNPDFLSKALKGVEDNYTTNSKGREVKGAEQVKIGINNPNDPIYIKDNTSLRMVLPVRLM